MPGAGHQAAEAVSMERVVDGLELEGHAGLAFEDEPQVGPIGGADAVPGRRAGLQPLAEPVRFRPGPSWRATGVGPLPEGGRAAAVVAGDPVPDRADAGSQGLGDRGGGAAPGGEDDGPVADPDPLLGDRPGQVLQVLEGEVVVDAHGGGSGGSAWSPTSCPTREAGGTPMQKIPGNRIS